MIGQRTEDLAREIFDRLSPLSRNDTERESTLARLRDSEPSIYAEVKSLLDHHDNTHDFFDSGVLNLNNVLSPDLARNVTNDEGLTQVGAYKIIKRLGYGGMGVVYEAQQETPRRSVALKLLRPDVSSRSVARRFEAEAEALGKLHHPGIAQIYEAGRAMVGGSDRMYIAMELLRGPTLGKYVKQSNLTTHQKIELVAHIADAVDHAHRRGVIHRDLKPGNIVIDETTDRPKVLDFGVARLATDDIQAQTMHTRAGQLLGTLEYMSPEQLAGDPTKVDARSDVYALGVILYELLSGDVPINLSGKDLFSAIDTVRSAEPRRLSRSINTFRGEVDDMTAMALEKDPARRYQTAQAFADDLRRYPSNQPVLAHKQTTWYQTKKFVQRHRTLVIATAAVFVALTTGLVAALYQANRAEKANADLADQLKEVQRLSTAESAARKDAEKANADLADQLKEVQRLSAAESEARKDAEQESQNSNAALVYLVTLLGQAAPEHTKGRDITVRDALDKAAVDVDRDFADRPKVRLHLFDVIRQTYMALGEAQRAEPYSRKAVELAKQLFADDPLAWGGYVGDLANVLINLDRNEEAETLVREALPFVVAKGGEDHELTAELQMHLGVALRHLERFDEAEPLLRTSLAHREKAFGPEDRKTMVVVNDLSLLLKYMGKFEESMQLARRNRDTTVKNLGEDHPDAIAASANLVGLLDTTAHDDEATLLAEQTLARAKRVLGEKHPDTLQVALALGTVLIDTKHNEDAIKVFEPTLDAMREVFGPEHNNTLNTMNNLSLAYERANQLEKASKTLEALAAVMVVKEPESIRTVITLGNRARVVRTLGQYQLSEDLAKQALDIATKILPPEHPLKTRSQIAYASSLIANGKLDDGLAIAEPAYNKLAEKGAHTPNAKSAARAVADSLKAANKPDLEAKWRIREQATDPQAPAPTQPK